MVFRGRGGFGNYVGSGAPVEQVTHSPVQHVSSPHQKFRIGRGGFGNTAEASQMQFPTPDEYLEEVKSADEAPRSYMIGRGGVGNFCARDAVRASRSDSMSSNGSDNRLGPVRTSPGIHPTTSRLWSKIKPSWTQ